MHDPAASAPDLRQTFGPPAVVSANLRLAWVKIGRASTILEAATDTVQRIAPGDLPPDVLALCKLAEDSAALARRALERALTARIGGRT